MGTSLYEPLKLPILRKEQKKVKGLGDTVMSQCSEVTNCESDDTVNSLGSPKLTWLPTSTR